MIWKVESVVQVDAAKIRPYEKNAMNHGAEQIKTLAKLIVEVGFLVPIILDKQFDIVAGHGRFEAGKLAGMDVFPCIFAEHLSARQIQAFRIADNQMGRLSTFNFENLASEISELVLQDFDVDLLGFDEQFLDGILKDDGDILPDGMPTVSDSPKFDRREKLKKGLTDDDEALEVEAKTVSKRGDIFDLGVHRVMCGDATDRTDVLNLLAGDEPILCVTDPPYGVKYNPDKRKNANGIFARNSETAALMEIENDDIVSWSDAYKLFPGAVLYVWHAGLKSGVVMNDLEFCGFELVSQIIWRKQHFELGRGDYQWQHEPCFYAVRRGEKHNWQGSRNEATVWDIRNLNPMGMNRLPENGKTGHSTQKPVECMLRPILNNSQEGDVVFDPFGGSGTTIIAAEKSLRVARVLEIKPEFVDLAIRRWQMFTGKKAMRTDGKTFDELAAENG